MKFATLMMVAAVSAAAAAPATKCPVLTGEEKKAADALKSKMTSAEKKAAEAALDKEITSSEASLKSATTKLDACYTKAKATTDAEKAATYKADTDACYVDHTTVAAYQKALDLLKCAK